VFGEMKGSRIRKDNFALAGVLEAILLIALVAIILSMIQLYYVPEMMNQREADHMDQVSNQFAQLKSIIETQAMMGSMETGEPITYTPMSSPINLGSKELPYFISARSYGQMDLIDTTIADDHKINIQPAPGDFPNGIPLTSIKYEAENFYFVDQTYVLEGGGIILSQSGGEVMRVNPGIVVENNSDVLNIKIKYFIPLYTGIPGKKIWADYKECYVYSNFTKHYTHSGSANLLYIATEYPNAWYDCLVNESRGIIWECFENGYLNVVLDDTVKPNRIVITPAIGYTLDLELTIAEIGVQIGPGYAIPNN
jgi:hypothetical protein